VLKLQEKTDLRISADLKLPVDAVTETFAFLAKRGAGKTYAAKVLAEEMLTAGAQVVILDPLDVWWGLRSSADGKGPGLPIAIFGGEHGDIPLEPTAGAFIADLLVSERLSAIVVTSEFSKNDQRRFATDFGERLFQKNREPVHLFLEEADRWAPQRPMRGEERMLGAYEEIVRRGRSKGIGASLITQRSAVLHKDVLTQTEVLVAMRTPSKHDRRAIQDWFDAHEADQVAEVMQSVPSLPTGTAWISSPYWLGTLQKVRFRQAKTFDSSSTPKVGQSQRQARTFADIDLAAIKEQMGETIERAKAEDPKELRRQIAQLERQLRQQRPAEPKTVVERVEVPVIRDEQIEAMIAVCGQMSSFATEIEAAATGLATAISQRSSTPPGVTNVPKSVQRPLTKEGPKSHVQPRQHVSGSGVQLPRAERRILQALAQYPEGRTKRQTAVLTGYAINGGGFNNALSALRSKELIEGRDSLRITDVGLEALGSDWEPLPTGRALLEHWMSQLPKAERTVLLVLSDVYPDSLPKETVAEIAGYEPTGGGFNNALSRLRTLELIKGRGELRASEDLVG
jgi:uncharacterized protein